MELLSKSVATPSGFVVIGKIITAHGIRGALKIKSFSGFPERFLELEEIYLSTSETLTNCQAYRVIHAQPLKSEQWLLRLAEIQDRTAAELLSGQFLCIPRSQLKTLPEDTFYVDDLIGYEALTETGHILGTVVEVIQGQQDLLVVETPEQKRHWIPFVKALVPSVERTNRRLFIHIIDGLLEL